MKYIVWYAYSGMETEGNLHLEEPIVLLARNKSEAIYKYLCYGAIRERREPYYKSFSEYDKSKYREGGWGFNVIRIHDDENIHYNEYLDKIYNDKYNK